MLSKNYLKTKIEYTYKKYNTFVIKGQNKV